MSLSREIIKQVFASVGIVAKPAFGKFGVTLPEFKLDKKLVVHYDDGQQREFPLWAGEGVFANNKARVLVAELSDEETIEYALALRVDSNAIYALRLAYDDEDLGSFFIQEGENWIGASRLVKAWALVGAEIMADQGVLWLPTSNYKDLYEAISHVIEM